MNTARQAAEAGDLSDFDDTDRVALAKARKIILLVAACLAAFALWAFFAVLDEVSTGPGTVVPASREQVIGSLQGGILAEIRVRQDDVVEAGQVVAQLDTGQAQSEIGENDARYRAALARAARLEAEADGMPLRFPEGLRDFPEIIDAETRLYETRRAAIDDAVRWLEESARLTRDELGINENLASLGAASNIDVIRLRKQLADLSFKAGEARADYAVKAREELAKVSAEIKMLASQRKGQDEGLRQLTLRSPVRGIVKRIEVSTIGGVVPPNSSMMEIIPLDDTLLVEARISPRDISYIHPNQRTTVKITAYDYAIYGGLEGQVASISPDTIRDEAKPELRYYRVYVRTERNALVNKAGRDFPIAPGMMASVDIHTGRKTVFDYLVKPLNRASEALRER